MQNHAEKARDIARSALPSTRRVEARKRRAVAHRRERAAWRREATALRRLTDRADHDGDLYWIARADIDELVAERRMADNVAPLIRWARAHVEADPDLRDLQLVDLLAHFRDVLPDDVTGRHALQHLDFVFDDSWRWRGSLGRRREKVDISLHLQRIVASGAHGVLNERLRRALTTRQRRVVWQVVDGVVREVRHDRSVPPRLLAGAHDVDAFAEAASDVAKAIVLALADECAGRPGPTASALP